VESDIPEKKKERLAQLLIRNKIRLARDALIKRYQQELGYQLKAEQFIDFDASLHIKQAVYHKVRDLQSQKIVEFVDFQDVLNTLNQLKQKIIRLSEEVIFYYLDKSYREGVETGGFKIRFEDFWEILGKISNNPGSDIIAVDASLAFGICIEPEEYSYLLTTWGL